MTYKILHFLYFITVLRIRFLFRIVHVDFLSDFPFRFLYSNLGHKTFSFVAWRFYQVIVFGKTEKEVVSENNRAIKVVCLIRAPSGRVTNNDPGPGVTSPGPSRAYLPIIGPRPRNGSETQSGPTLRCETTR